MPSSQPASNSGSLTDAGEALTWAVAGMHCGGCESKLVSATARLPGVKHAIANAKAGTITITTIPANEAETFDEQALSAALAKAVAAAGDYTLGERLHAAPTPSSLPTAASTSSASSSAAAAMEEDNVRGYRQLVTLVLVILAASVAAQTPSWQAGASTPHFLMGVMSNFMAGFFLSFGFFKLLDLPAFVSGYARYDIIAANFRPWAWAYPFVEIALGLLYAARIWPTAVNAATLIIMLVGGIGVVRSLQKKDRVRCACLGNAINLPIGPVTLIEDFGMAIMAAAMLVMMHA